MQFSANIDCFECVDFNALPDVNLHVACESPDAVFKKTYCDAQVGYHAISDIKLQQSGLGCCSILLPVQCRYRLPLPVQGVGSTVLTVLE